MSGGIEQNTLRSYAVDSEHSALRLSIVFIFIVIWAASFLMLNTLIHSEGLNLIALIGSFLLTALLTQQIEGALKKRWPSGRSLQIERNAISIADRKGVQQSINGSQQVNVLLWRFTIKRRARVPKGWFMVACALEQDETYLAVYTFMSPEQFKVLGAPSQFVTLLSQKETASQKGAGPADLRLAGEQRRLHIAENIRWTDGAEMSVNDFTDLIRSLQAQFPQWMPFVL